IFNFSPPLFLTYHYFAFIKKQQMINFQSRNKILLDVPLKVKTIESSKGFLSLTICNPLRKGEQIDKIFICFYIFLFPNENSVFAGFFTRFNIRQSISNHITFP